MKDISVLFEEYKGIMKSIYDDLQNKLQPIMLL